MASEIERADRDNLYKSGEDSVVADGDQEDEDVITEKLDAFSIESYDGNNNDGDNGGSTFHNKTLDSLNREPPEEPSVQAETPIGPSKWKTAYQNTKHFAGGLVSHPFESTKHFSVLRHSHGLVFYRGPLTSIAITIFSDEPLPADRTLWLQSKGWTGKTGLKIKTLARANAGWIDVTPSETLDPQRSLPSDNRAWERDISKFVKKAPRQLRKHLPRETAVIRVPCEAEDGYFRIILCASGSKRSLCPSPVFRVASTGLSSAKFKGAGLRTLPLEIGVKVLSSMASNATYNLVSPVTQQVQNQFGKYMPGFLTQEAGTTAYTAIGAQEKIGETNKQYQMSRKDAFEPLEHQPSELSFIGPLGNNEGPEIPFPVSFSAKVIEGRGEDRKETGAPTANLKGVPEDVKAKLTGVYFGWACLLLPQSKKETQDGMLNGWKEAIITVAPSAKATPTVAPNKEFRAYLIQDFGDLKFFNAKISVLVLGYLHSFKPFDSETSTMELYRDIVVTQLSLARPAWAADAVMEQTKLLNKSRSLTDRYVNARKHAQKVVDKVPLHTLGVRMDSMGIRDKWVGNGGFSIPR
ncbi:hypothetical protein MMC10_009798 [Thelotrema lepadinum]|nr:hypothetical protein [Thelotrema lepadinum]